MKFMVARDSACYDMLYGRFVQYVGLLYNVTSTAVDRKS
jgi:hypothetical protein